MICLSIGRADLWAVVRTESAPSSIYAPSVASDDEYSLIRIFPDFADSVIWFVIGTVSYEESRVSADLRRDMEAWQAHYEETMGNTFVWRSREDHAYHAAEGRRLAERLAAEVGQDFKVEYFDVRDRKVQVRSSRPATNKAAAQALSTVATSHREFDERIEREAEEGASFGWFANCPNGEIGKHDDGQTDRDHA